MRFTAKASLFGQKTFSSWLIEAAGTVPIQRRKDNPDGTADNSGAMTALIEVCRVHCCYDSNQHKLNGSCFRRWKLGTLFVSFPRESAGITQRRLL